jgi:hypothetical protein
VVLQAITTPRTVATDHIIRRLGLNFRAGDPARGSDGLWHVPLRALVPASPDVVPRREDQLYYRFEPFGEILLDSNLNVVQVPRKSELSVKFREEISSLFARIEAMILEYGSDKWGRIPLIRSFLNPLNAIVSQALSLPNISMVRLQQQEYSPYADWMKKAGFLEESKDRPGHLRRTNQLVAIADKYRKEKGFSFYVDETTIDVTSIICWKFYPEVIERIKVIPSYVDTTVAYYVKAVKTKRLVPMSVSELEYSYNVLGRREQDTKVTFYGKVADLVTAGFLTWASEGVVVGVDDIYKKVESLGPELGDNVHLLKAIA